MKLIDYFSIIESRHAFQNPTSERKLDLLIGYCGVADGMRVLDVGCGKAWLLRRMATNHTIDGVGIELRSTFLDEARQQIQRAPSKGSITLHRMPATDYPAEPQRFDIGLCIGASFAIGSFEDMLKWLKPQIKSEGCLAIGDVYAKKPDLAGELEMHFSGAVRNLSETVQILNGHGLELIGLIDSSVDDWDEYESLHWLAADEWLRANGSHPDCDEFRELSNACRRRHLKFDRDALGWAIFVCRVM